MRQTHLNTITEIISPRLNRKGRVKVFICSENVHLLKCLNSEKTPDRAGCYTCRKREAPDSGHSNHRGGHAHAQHGHYGHYYGWSGGHHAHPAHHPVNGTV